MHPPRPPPPGAEGCPSLLLHAQRGNELCQMAFFVTRSIDRPLGREGGGYFLLLKQTRDRPPAFLRKARRGGEKKRARRAPSEVAVRHVRR